MMGRKEWDLLDCFLNGTCTPDQHRHLVELLRRDPDAQRALISAADQESAVRRLLAAREGVQYEQDYPDEVRSDKAWPKPRTQRVGLRADARQRSRWIVAAAVMLVAILGLFLATRAPGIKQQPQGVARPGSAEGDVPRARPDRAVQPPAEGSQRPEGSATPRPEGDPVEKRPEVLAPREVKPDAPAEQIPPKKGPPSALPPLPEDPPVPRKPDEPKPESPKESRAVVAGLSEIRGVVEVVSGTQRLRARDGLEVLPEQGVQSVGAASGAQLQFGDGTRVQIFGETTIERLRTDGGKRMTLKAGGIRAQVARQPLTQPMTIETPHGIATVLGTTLRMAVHREKNGEFTRLEVEEGKVRLSRIDGKAIELQGGEYAVVSAEAGEFKKRSLADLGLVGHWKFDEGQGTSVRDSSGAALHGTALKGSWVAGKVGAALRFDGVRSYVALPGRALDGHQQVTVALWVRMAQKKAGTLLSAANPKQGNAFGIWVHPDEGILLGPSANDEWKIADIADGRWHHVAVTYDGSAKEAALHLDGARVGSRARSLEMVVDPKGLYLGQDQDVVGGGFEVAQAFQGELDDLRIYHRVLPLADVRILAEIKSR